MSEKDIVDLAKRYLYMQWLRPENAVWDATAASLIGGALTKEPGAIAEIGIGNGYFSFMALGGRFTPEYDWYFNVDPAGFYDNADIYNHARAKNIASFIEKRPDRRLSLAIDHKSELVAQAEQLGFIDRVLVADANGPMALGGPRLVYSNILYWLRDPVATLKNIARQLEAGAKLVLAFPNPSFLETCESYRNPSPFWAALNRGRASSMLWSMDLAEFERAAKPLGLEVQAARRYLSRQTLKIWDVGLRPLSSPLIKMGNALDVAKRREIKTDWCEGLARFLPDLVAEELENGPKNGGFNFVDLVKIR